MRRIGALLVLLTVTAAGAPAVQKYTRGVGVYPGNPAEDHPPVLVPDSSSYRNLALHRPAYQSSSYDFNLTAQLLTDGVRQRTLPRWLVTILSTTGAAEKQQREFLLDHSATSTVNLGGPGGWMQFELAGGDAPVEIDRIELDARFRPRQAPRSPGTPNPAQPAGSPAAAPPAGPTEWSSVVTGSDDGQAWHEIGRSTGVTAPLPAPGGAGAAGVAVHPSVSFAQSSRYRIHRVAVQAAGDGSWAVSEVRFLHGNQPVEAGGPYQFYSAWMAGGKGEEWVYVDLGARCTFDRVALHWIRRAAEGVAAGVRRRRGVERRRAAAAGRGPSDDLKLDRPAQGRYVRVLMTRPQAPEGYILSELEVFGRGGPVPRRAARPALSPRRWTPRSRRRSTGACSATRSSTADGAALVQAGLRGCGVGAGHRAGHRAHQLLERGRAAGPQLRRQPADDLRFLLPRRLLVPHGVRGAAVRWPAAGSGSTSTASTGRPTSFSTARSSAASRAAFMRGALRRDRACIRRAERNALAVRVEKNATPGSVKEKTLRDARHERRRPRRRQPDLPRLDRLGLDPDDPRPQHRDLERRVPHDQRAGDDRAPVRADDAAAAGHDAGRRARRGRRCATTSRSRCRGTLRGRFGDVAVRAAGHARGRRRRRTVVLDPSTHPALRLANPRLWWPAGYGEPDLYDVELRVRRRRRQNFGRQALPGRRAPVHLQRGRRHAPDVDQRPPLHRPRRQLGLPASRCCATAAREYDAAVRYHRDMNFTMIRNWVGQTGDDEFYDACDRHGIVVWQDFWLANPWDGPDPDDNDLFLSNVDGHVLRIRNHPSVGLYCGRNEGYPPKPLDDAIRATAGGSASRPALHLRAPPTTCVSGHGPYRAMPPKYYFQNRATPKIHSEMGMPNIVTLDSLRQMMPEAALWPLGRDVGLARLLPRRRAGRPVVPRARSQKSYGGADNADGLGDARAVRQLRGLPRDVRGAEPQPHGPAALDEPSRLALVRLADLRLLLRADGRLLRRKKGSEPLHIQWNPTTETRRGRELQRRRARRA